MHFEVVGNSQVTQDGEDGFLTFTVQGVRELFLETGSPSLHVHFGY